MTASHPATRPVKPVAREASRHSRKESWTKRARPAPSQPAAGPEVRSLDDAELMRTMHDGDTSAFELIYERHVGAAYALACRICGRRGLAEDVTQEAFLALWRSGARYDTARGSVRNWLLGIVRNRAIDAMRRSLVHDRRRASDEGLAERLEARERTEDEVTRLEEIALVRSALAELPPKQMHVIDLAYFGGLTHPEIADRLDTPVGTVKGRMRLGLEKLAQKIER